MYVYSGAVYTGGWKANKKHGWGKLVLQNGRVFEGSFESDRMVGGALQEEGEGLLRPRTPLGSLIGEVIQQSILPIASFPGLPHLFLIAYCKQ